MENDNVVLWRSYHSTKDVPMHLMICLSGQDDVLNHTTSIFDHGKQIRTQNWSSSAINNAIRHKQIGKCRQYIILLSLSLSSFPLKSTVTKRTTIINNPGNISNICNNWRWKQYIDCNIAICTKTLHDSSLHEIEIKASHNECRKMKKGHWCARICFMRHQYRTNINHQQWLQSKSKCPTIKCMDECKFNDSKSPVIKNNWFGTIETICNSMNACALVNEWTNECSYFHTYVELSSKLQFQLTAC